MSLIHLGLEVGVVFPRRHLDAPGQHLAPAAVVVFKGPLHAPDAAAPLGGGLGEEESQGQGVVGVVALYIPVFPLPQEGGLQIGPAVIGGKAVAGDEVGLYIGKPGADILPPLVVRVIVAQISARGIVLYVGGLRHAVIPSAALSEGGLPRPAVDGQVVLLILRLIIAEEGEEKAHGAVQLLHGRLVAGAVVYGGKDRLRTVPQVPVKEYHGVLHDVDGDGQGEPAPQVIEGGVGQEGVRVRRGGRIGRLGLGRGRCLRGWGHDGRPSNKGAAPQQQGGAQGQGQGGGALSLQVHQIHQPFLQMLLFLTQGGDNQSLGGRRRQGKQGLPVPPPLLRTQLPHRSLVAGELTPPGQLPAEEGHEGIEPVDAGHQG